MPAQSNGMQHPTAVPWFCGLHNWTFLSHGQLSHAGIQETTQQQDSSKSCQQLLENSRRLLKLKNETQKAVTAVRVHGDELENARRQREEHMRQVGPV